jgi:signal transduction histidine kinase
MDKLTKIDKHVTTLDLVKIKPIFIQIIDNYLNENQTIVHKFDLDCEEINTDAYLIKKLFELIIDNSVQFKNTEIPLLLSVRIKRLSDDKWQLSITDNGIGIEEQHLNRIFQLYQRLNNNSSTNGSGVGLALAKRIVNKLNGEIWVESHLNVGTTVNISLPINTPYELV